MQEINKKGSILLYYIMNVKQKNTSSDNLCPSYKRCFTGMSDVQSTSFHIPANDMRCVKAQDWYEHWYESAFMYIYQGFRMIIKHSCVLINQYRADPYMCM